MLNPREFKLVAGEDPAVNNFTLNGRERHCLFVNGGGQRFIEGGYALGIDNDLEGRGVAIGDLDQDGALDIVVRSAARQRLTYYHNEVGARAHFLRVELQGTRSNRDAIGTVARLRGNGMTQSRLKMAGNGFQGQSEGTLHFGLGAATHAEELVIQWPSGRVQRFGKPPVDHVVRVVEGSDKLTARRLPNWRPSAAAPTVPEAWRARSVSSWPVECAN